MNKFCANFGRIDYLAQRMIRTDLVDEPYALVQTWYNSFLGWNLTGQSTLLAESDMRCTKLLCTIDLVTCLG